LKSIIGNPLQKGTPMRAILLNLQRNTRIFRDRTFHEWLLQPSFPIALPTPSPSATELPVTR